MANFQIPPPDILELTDGSTASNWRTWVAAWKNYSLATKLDKEDEVRQVATLLAVIGKEANKVFRTFTWASAGDEKKIAPVLKQFEDYCIPRENTIYERFLFFTRDQRESETVDQYMTELRQIAGNCDFESLTPEQLLRDRLVTGTRNDFVIVGYGNTPAEWQSDHDKNVRAFLNRCRDRNLKLNEKKARLRQQEIPFIGHVLTPEGFKPDPCKVEAIVQMPDPTDVHSLRRFLGMVNYLAKFLLRLSDETEVLRKLTERDAEWCWLPAYADALARVKEMIVTAPVLAYYDVSKPVVIQCDASQTGLGAALLQEGCPVAYSSRVMTPTEQNYAQIEKELLAIVFACEKFDQYIFGRSDVVVQSDHKPLETIFKKPIHSSPKRLQRIRLRLQNYDIQVEYKKGSQLSQTVMSVPLRNDYLPLS